MLNLYELSENYTNIANLLDDPTIEQEVITQALATIEADITTKAGDIAAVMQGIEADIEAVRAEEKRLADRRRTAENRIKWLKNYIQENMENCGIDKIKTPTFTLSIQNNPPRVEVADITKLPKKYVLETISYAPDKKALADAIKAGESVDGAHLTQGRSLRIR